MNSTDQTKWKNLVPFFIQAIVIMIWGVKNDIIKYTYIV